MKFKLPDIPNTLFIIVIGIFLGLFFTGLCSEVKKLEDRIIELKEWENTHKWAIAAYESAHSGENEIIEYLGEE